MDEAQEQYLEHLGKAMLEQIDQGFDKGTDALGQPWAELDAETVARKGHSDVLIDSGDFRDSFTYQVDERRNAVAVGSNSPLIEYHEFGTQDMPRRPILQPASTWAEQKLIVPLGKEVIGNALDGVTF
ncbi:phage virion morphogenesis protein (plasmid) [Halorarum halophilum]|uniref:Phage virion morphogenesis protein n=1 Tax=Halorarum halophilum TaxID=2743090 RepID=A0A7D5KAV1_9EURY|nr:HK97-gp10 family putative phage morphogenesis protein [Halobaculum halophilum]QLG30174.1 phage virion morphogenesis protein [Halobaculum halophilum]